MKSSGIKVENKHFFADGFDFVKCGDELMVIGYSGNDEYLCIPDSVGGLPVTAIGEYVFCDMHDAGIELLDVRTIKDDQGTSEVIKGIQLPETLESISSAAFFGCVALERIVIPESVRSVGSAAFAACRRLKEVILSPRLKTINAGMFRGCKELCSADIPDKVESIEHLAFDGCSSLNELKLPDGLENIGAMAFQGCSSLRNIEVPESVKSIGQGAFAQSGLEECIIKSHINALPPALFSNCNRLRKVILSSETEEIGSNAFDFCDSLTTVSYIGD